MATIHFVLQGKGGVGKSTISSMLYQGLDALGQNVKAYDSDPVNATLAGFKEFNVERLDLLSPDGNINARKFDELLELLAGAPQNSHIVVDNGASSFIALGSYMQENDMLEVLESYGHTVFAHLIITGGQSFMDTLNGFTEFGHAFPNSRIVVWLNPFFGSIEMDGKKFHEFKCYREYEHNIHAVIELPMGNKELIGKDLEQLFAKRMSFEAGINGSGHIAMRSRLKKYWKTILGFLEQANLV